MKKKELEKLIIKIINDEELDLNYDEDEEDYEDVDKKDYENDDKK